MSIERGPPVVSLIQSRYLCRALLAGVAFLNHQRLRIHYHCVGEIVIPETLSLPVPEVSVNTRKGVTVVYEPNATNPSDVA